MALRAGRAPHPARAPRLGTSRVVRGCATSSPKHPAFLLWAPARDSPRRAQQSLQRALPSARGPRHALAVRLETALHSGTTDSRAALHSGTADSRTALHSGPVRLDASPKTAVFNLAPQSSAKLNTAVSERESEHWTRRECAARRVHSTECTQRLCRALRVHPGRGPIRRTRLHDVHCAQDTRAPTALGFSDGP